MIVKVLLELVIRAFQDGAAPESIVQRYSTLSLSDVYMNFLVDYNLRGQAALLWGAIAAEGWLSKPADDHPDYKSKHGG